MNGFIWPTPSEKKYAVRNAKSIQPTMSSMVAVAKIIEPTLLLSIPKSIKILAITGRAEIDKAVPMNNGKSQLFSDGI